MEAVRVSLIASLLIFAFENLQGDHESAVRHIQTAIKFMRAHLSSAVRWDPEKHALTSVRGLDDEVAALLVHIDGVFVVTEFMAGERLFHVEFMEWDIHMPSVFQSIHEVINYLQQWQIRIGPYIPRLRAVWSGLDDSDSVVPRGPPDYFEKTIKYAQQWLHTCKPLISKEDPKSRACKS
jgi:hypothetical protein